MPTKKRVATVKSSRPAEGRRGASRAARRAGAGPRQGAPDLAAGPARAQVRRRKLVTALSVALMAVGLGVMAYPFIPIVRYQLFRPAPTLQYQTRFAALAAGDAQVADGAEVTAEDINLDQVAAGPDPATLLPPPNSNRLVIPKIGVDVEIVQGDDPDEALERGIWHIPGTPSPDEGGNFVISGHRFRFLRGNRTLYLLDKLEKGDPIIVFWEGKEYDYVVRKDKIVKPTAVEILDNTEKPRLTIFTCSPLFSTKERLVLIAKPV